MDTLLADDRTALHRFERALRARMRRLLRPGDATLVVGASGGPDSTALLLALAASARGLGVQLVAAHLDHGLRGEAARADRDFVLALATRLGVRFEEGKAPPLDARGRGVEAAAREARYEFLLETAERLGASAVLVAHTATDQAETVLLRILRGAGLRGLAAMPESRRLARGARVRLVRPLLGVGRDRVEAYLADREIVAREDAMNADLRFARVRVRRELLPRAIDLVNPAAEAALGRVALAARSAARALERDARRLLARAAAPAESLPADQDGYRRAVLARSSDAVLDVALARVLRRLSPDDHARAHVRALAALVRTGRGQVALPGGLAAWSEGDLLRLGAAPSRPGEPDAAPPVHLPVPGQAVWQGHRVEARVVPAGALSSDPLKACLDLARATGSLAVRGRREGDRFVPLGSSGATTLKRFFIDRKIPRAQRAGVPIVTLDDLPIWVVGERIDDRMKVTAATRDVLELRASRPPRQETSLD
jgi:tRNA(Ile)-lysidine synthase